MRGKLGRGYIDMTAGGITPACAGKTSMQKNSFPQKRDHPRVCGENDGYVEKASAAQGSPPRVRGKPCGTIGGMPASRITPACAGKTVRFTLS